MKKSILFLFTLLPFILIGQKLDHKLGDIIVQMRKGYDTKTLVKDLTQYNNRSTGIVEVEKLSESMNIYLLHFDYTRIHERDFGHEIKKHDDVIEIQKNHFSYYRQTIPNDELYNQQWQWFNDGSNGGIEDADIDAELAWDITTGGVSANGDTIVIAVFDDGVDLDHPDMMPNNWINRNEIPNNNIDDDENGYIDDYLGWNTTSLNDDVEGGWHGSSVNGMIGAAGNNTFGVTGINWNIKIMSIVRTSLIDSEIIKSYEYALTMRQLYDETNGEKGAFIVATNSSFGLDATDPADFPLWCAMFDSLGNAGVLSACATSNSNLNIDVSLDVPTACASEFMISVTATNSSDERTFSGFGVEHVDVAAPGQSVFVTSVGGGNGNHTGTSFASPTVAGIIGLMYSADCPALMDLMADSPAAAAELVRDAIYQSVDFKSNLATETKYQGRVNAFNAITYLLNACSDCPNPISINFSDVIDTSALVNWSELDSTDQVDLRYKLVDDTTWATIENISKPYTLNGLMGCESYEVQLRSSCGDSINDFGQSKLLYTDGCCELPSDIQLIFATETSAYLEWNSVLAADSFIVLYQLNGGWTTATTYTNSITIENLSPCTKYSYRVRTLCDGSTTDNTPISNFTTKGCGNCTDLEYCEASGENTSDEYIESVMLNQSLNISGNDEGYGDYTGMPMVVVSPEDSIAVVLTPGYSGTTYSETFLVFIDFNQDGTFDPDELVLEFEPTTVAVTGSFMVPIDASPGTTRLRVKMNWDDDDPKIPCGSHEYGEVEDYCIEITKGCSIISGLHATDTTDNSITVAWNTDTSSIAYAFRYRELNAPDWIEVEVMDTFYTIESNTPCLKYEVQVKNFCSFDTSGYSPTMIFDTCPIAVTDLNISKDLFVFPNPFSEELFLEIFMEQAGDLEIDIYNSNGIKVSTISEKNLQEGRHSIQWSELDNLPSGVFFLTLTTENSRMVKKIIHVD